MNRELENRYLEAVRYLDDNFAYFLTHVLNIGKPQTTRSVPTAAVAVERTSKDIDADFKFLFNLEFAQGLSDEEMGFVLGHETMHILLNHLRLNKLDRYSWSPTCQDDCKARIAKLGRKEVMSDEEMRKPICHECKLLQFKFNIAADCVINDYLTGMGMMAPPNLFHGDKVVGYNCAHATVSTVFNDIPEDFTKCDGNCQPGGSGMPCDGSCGGSKADEFDQIDDHGWMRDSDQSQEDAADKAGEGNPNMPGELDRTKQDDDYKSSQNPGKGAGSKQEFAELQGVSLLWAKLLEEVNPFIYRDGPKPRASWHRQPRKLAAMGGDVRLPVYKPGPTGIGSKKPALVMAIDTSGSIGSKQANEFINMARSVPQNKVKLWTCTFTDRYMDLDLDDPEWQTGGTHFDAISSYIEDVVVPANHKRYPTAVVVVSDGYASFSERRPEGKQENAWWWLLTTPVDSLYGGGDFPGHMKQLNDYMKG